MHPKPTPTAPSAPPNRKAVRASWAAKPSKLKNLARQQRRLNSWRAFK